MEYDYDNLSDQDCREIELMSWKNKVVRHFTGNFYMLLDVAQNTENKERLVVYRALYTDCKLYVTPLKAFAGKCTKEQFDKYGQEHIFDMIKYTREDNDLDCEKYIDVRQTGEKKE